MAMDKKPEEKAKKKNFFTILKESIIKTNEGCGPGCGCHSTPVITNIKTDENTKGKKNS